jgi:membrane-associated protease RseP (regulator of RpoE activity)
MIEKVKGRAVNQKFETISHTLGFALLMLLVLVITYKDIQKYQSSFIGVWERITGVFS